MPLNRERMNNKFVKKTPSLPAWLAAKADESGVNCSKIFQNALMDYLHVREETMVMRNIHLQGNKPLEKRTQILIILIFVQ